MSELFLNKFIKESEDQSSASFIQTSDLKNRFLYPYIPTIVIDDFYEDPDLWRHYALKQEYIKGDRGNWPGLRSTLFHESNRELFDISLKKILFVLKEYGISKVKSLQTSFSLIDETYGRGWVHDDDPQFQVAGVIYLNPEAPLGSGTTIYEDSADFDGKKFSKFFIDDVNSDDASKRETYKKYREEQISHFNKTIEIENVYNRCIMFDTRNWHSADMFFGKTKEDARLTQVFFIKAS